MTRALCFAAVRVAEPMPHVPVLEDGGKKARKKRPHR